MLFFVDKRKGIQVLRSKRLGQPTNLLLGVIVKPDYKFRAADGITPSNEEQEQIQFVLSAYGDKNASKELLAALAFPQSTRKVLEFYSTRKEPAEKEVIASRISQASRLLKVQQRRERVAAAPSEKKIALPSVLPEVFAAALYDVLAENRSSKVSGDPRASKKTRIEGLFDLQQIAEKLLRKAP